MPKNTRFYQTNFKTDSDRPKTNFKTVRFFGQKAAERMRSETRIDATGNVASFERRCYTGSHPSPPAAGTEKEPSDA